MVTFRKASKKEIKEVAELTTKSFGEYPLFEICFKHRFKREEKYKKFMHILLRIHIRTFALKNTVLVAENDGKIVAMALVVNPKYKESSIMDYVMAGGFNIFWNVGARGIRDIRNVERQAEEFFYSGYKDSWFLALIAVDSNFKGQKIGTRMLHECVIPYVRDRGAKQLTLSTNDERNRKFYTDNGFTEVEEKQIKLYDKSIPSWAYVMDIN